jgi:etoposide-induced protein 2.4 (EI24)
MSLLLDSFWRAVAYCLHPRVVVLSLLPLVLMVLLALGFWHFFWDGAVAGMLGLLDRFEWLHALWAWLQGWGAGDARAYAAPVLVLVLAVPAMVLLSLALVAVLMTPALVSLVARRRFPQLERRHGGSVLLSVCWSLGSTLLAFLALGISMPLWLVPPLVLVLPPLIWGWLTYRVMAFDALAEHADAQERRLLFVRHRHWLLGIGVLCGYLGAAPSIVWASGLLFATAFVVLVPLAIWIYTLVFAFSSLWFIHYGLAALQQLRQENAAVPLGSADATFTDTSTAGPAGRR